MHARTATWSLKSEGNPPPHAVREQNSWHVGSSRPIYDAISKLFLSILLCGVSGSAADLCAFHPRFTKPNFMACARLAAAVGLLAFVLNQVPTLGVKALPDPPTEVLRHDFRRAVGGRLDRHSGQGWVQQAVRSLGGDQPFILTRTPLVKKWKAFSAWQSPSAFAKDMAGQSSLDACTAATEHVSFPGAYQNTGPVFGPYYDASRPLHSFVQGSLPYVSNVTLPLADLLPSICADRQEEPLPASGASPLAASGQVGHADISVDSAGESTPVRWSYLSGGVDDLLTPAVQRRRLLGLSSLVELNPRKSSVNMWLGQSGVVAPCHYDGYHNVFVQVGGRKRFLLWSPQAWRQLNPRPFLHPQHAQCGVNVSAEWGTMGPLAMVADLGPKDVLYLPPAWFHEVVSLQDSISLNAWTVDEGLEVASAGLFGQRPPAAPQPSSHSPASLARRALLPIIAALRACAADEACAVPLLPGDTPTSAALTWLRDVSESRYGELVRGGTLACPKHLYPTPDEQNWDAGPVNVQAGSKLAAWAQRAAEAMQALPRDLAELWIGNWVKFQAALALGGAPGVACLLTHWHLH